MKLSKFIQGSNMRWEEYEQRLERLADYLSQKQMRQDSWEI